MQRPNRCRNIFSEIRNFRPTAYGFETLPYVLRDVLSQAGQ